MGEEISLKVAGKVGWIVVEGIGFKVGGRVSMLVGEAVWMEVGTRVVGSDVGKAVGCVVGLNAAKGSREICGS